MKAMWRGMAGFRLLLGLAPHQVWRRGLEALGFPDSPTTTWFAAELTRGSARDVAEAGRELGRFDSRPWVADLRPPAAVVLTARDDAVPPRHQRELARLLGAPAIDVDGDHGAVTARADEFNTALLQALEAVGGAIAARTAAA